MNTFSFGVVLLLFLVVTAKADGPIIGSVAANLDTFNQFTLNWFSVQGDSTLVSNLTTIGGLMPGAMAFIPGQKPSLLFIGLDDQGTSTASIVSISGAVLGRWEYPNSVLTNVAYDINTAQSFVSSYVVAEEKNYVFELLPNGTLSKVVQVPGTVQVAISTYCPIGHIFFLTLETDDGGNELVRVDLHNKSVISSVLVTDAIEILIWDYTDSTLYAWVATEGAAGVFVVLDPATGNRTKTIVEFPTYSANGGTATLDLTTKTVYSSLLDTSQDLTPIWVSLDIPTGTALLRPTEPSLGFPINLATVPAQ